jgi:N-methylhydantoinase A
MDAAALADLIQRFHRGHEQLYTYRLPGDHVDVTNVRLDAVGRQPSPQLTPWTARGSAAGALREHRSVLFDVAQGRLDTPVYRRELLAAGVHLAGPCIVEEETATTVLLPGQSLTVDAFGNLLCTLV